MNLSVIVLSCLYFCLYLYLKKSKTMEILLNHSCFSYISMDHELSVLFNVD